MSKSVATPINSDRRPNVTVNSTVATNVRRTDRHFLYPSTEKKKVNDGVTVLAG